MWYNVFTIKINFFKYKRFKDGRCTYKKYWVEPPWSWLNLNSIQTNPERNKRKNSNKKEHLSKIHVFLVTICLHWYHHLVNWGEWGACSVTCGPGQRWRKGCGKSLKTGQTCPPGHVERETEECSIVPCTGKLSIMESMIRNYHCLEHNQGTMISS